jgi:hypothetical protein
MSQPKEFSSQKDVTEATLWRFDSVLDWILVISALWERAFLRSDARVKQSPT